MISLFSGLPRVFKHALLWKNFESKQYLVSNNMKEEWFVTFKLLFCEARYCPDHVVVRIRAFDLCRIRLGRGGGFSIALYIHWGVGIFDYSLYCFGLKS